MAKLFLTTKMLWSKLYPHKIQMQALKNYGSSSKLMLERKRQFEIWSYYIWSLRMISIANLFSIIQFVISPESL